MIVHPKVANWARQWGLDPHLIQAIVDAEGGIDHIVKAVQCSVPSVVTVDEALMITCRSTTHALCDYVKAHSREDFVAFFGARWAPVGVANDPTQLNANWVGNVQRGWLA